jgi:hypothetical protein
MTKIYCGANSILLPKNATLLPPSWYEGRLVQQIEMQVNECSATNKVPLEMRVEGSNLFTWYVIEKFNFFNTIDAKLWIPSETDLTGQEATTFIPPMKFVYFHKSTTNETRQVLTTTEKPFKLILRTWEEDSSYAATVVEKINTRGMFTGETAKTKNEERFPTICTGEVHITITFKEPETVLDFFTK